MEFLYPNRSSSQMGAPNSTTEQNDELLRSFSLAAEQQHNYDACFVMGNLNLDIDWSAEPPLPRAIPAEKCIDAFANLAFSQLKKNPRTTATSEKTIDLFLCDTPNLVSSSEVIAGVSDHDALLAELRVDSRRPTPLPAMLPNWRRAPWPKLNDRLAEEMQAVLNINNLIDAWTAWKTTLVLRLPNFSPPEADYPFLRRVPSQEEKLSEWRITESDVDNLLHVLDAKSATGPDGVPAVLLKRCAKTLCPSLAHIFNLSLRACDLPADWKCAAVTPIPKDGEKSDLRNYRPISVTSLVAFDKVPHQRLLSKLQHHGIDGAALEWLKNFLVGRSQFVRFGGARSVPCVVSSGVVQGSVLGPLLFNVYVSDLPAVVKTNLVQNADDCTIFREVTSQDDVDELQEDLALIDIWCVNNGIQLNTKKCVAMDLSRARQPWLPQYMIGGAVLEYVSTQRLLGVHIARDLRWNHHVDVQRKKAAQTLGFAARNLRGCTQRVKRMAYLTLVKPKLFYGTPAWHPWKKTNTEKMARTQNKALHFIHGRHVPPPEKQNMLSVPAQLAYNDLLFFKKSLCGLTEYNAMARITEGRVHRSDDPLHPRLQQPPARTELGQNAFDYRIVAEWNAAPPAIKDCTAAQFPAVSPNSKPQQNDEQLLSPSLAAEQQHNYDACFVMGNFNLDVDWSTKTPLPRATLAEQFLDAFDNFAFAQLIKNATRTTATSEKTFDLFLCNTPNLVSTSEVIAGVSDHDALLIGLKVDSRRPQPMSKMPPDWRRAHWPALNDLLAVKLQVVMQEDGLEEACTDPYFRFFSEPAAVASQFLATFKQNFSPPGTDFPFLRLAPIQDEKLSKFHVTASKVSALLHVLDAKNATGPDGIPAVVLKNCADTICPSLAHIFKLWLRVLPADWKCAAVKPIPKEAAGSSGQHVHAVFLDWAKAFDRVPHQRLLSKLQHHGVDCEALRWLKNFLVGRSQFVRFGGARSEPCEVTSGEIQGSVLGPLLFNIYVSDLPAALKTNLVQYADDCTVFKVVSCQDDVDELQDDLALVDIWCTNNGMQLNAKKCVAMDISRARQPWTPQYTIGGVVLDYVCTQRLISVHISRDLRWNHHVDVKRKKAARSLGFAARNLRGCTQRVKRMAYLTLVKPKLFYGTPAWHPWTKANIGKMARTQNKALHFIFGRHVQPPQNMKMLSVLAQLVYNDLLFKKSLCCLTEYNAMPRIIVGRVHRGDDPQHPRLQQPPELGQCVFDYQVIAFWKAAPPALKDCSAAQFPSKCKAYVSERF
ncbi:Hypothetical predicted protein [Cloeon dipterum]|uniref:Reverse transcriptase domain-containing protein n=1 Tax=Cloeon dipterum TaxID=197152 RepID=A0A8S1DY07_9INSE|nr:Hypothetical predicted protein [Cloeon dipterum]